MTFLHILRKQARSTSNLGTATIIYGEGKHHTRMVLCLLKAIHKYIARFSRQGTDVAQKNHADLLALKKWKLLDEGLRKKMHEKVYLGLRTRPVLGRKGIGRKHLYAQANAGGDNLA